MGTPLNNNKVRVTRPWQSRLHIMGYPVYIQHISNIFLRRRVHFETQGNIIALVAYLMKDKSRGAFYLIKLSGQTSLAVRRIPLFIRTIQPDQSTL